MVRTPNPLVIIVVRKDILLMYAGESLQIRMSSLWIWVIVISSTRKVIKNMNAEPRPCIHTDLKDIDTTIRSMDTKLLNADPNPYGHQISQQEKEAMDTSTTRIITQDKAIIIVKSMDKFLRIALENILVVTTIYAWVKPDDLAIWILVIP